MKGLIVTGLFILLAYVSWPWLARHIPPALNPFAPLSVTDPPGMISRFKMKQLVTDPAACLDVLQRAASAGYIRFTQPAPMQGKCPLPNPVRIQQFGDVRLSSSFLATCPLAVASTRFVLQANALAAQSEFHSPLARIDHVGSYACRNIYHRSEGRLSEHATAEAWDVTAFRLKNGQQLSIIKNWQQPPAHAALLKQLFTSSCDYFGNSLGPEYNAAHASHFHLGMRGFGLCR